MYTVDAGELHGRSLRAKVKVPITRYGGDGEQPIGYIPAGGIVGVVASHLKVNPGRRSRVHWQFLTRDGRQYHVAHVEDWFDWQHLQDQGVLTTVQRRELQRRADQNIVWQFLEDNATFVKDNASRLLTFAGMGIVLYLGIKALK